MVPVPSPPSVRCAGFGPDPIGGGDNWKARGGQRVSGLSSRLQPAGIMHVTQHESPGGNFVTVPQKGSSFERYVEYSTAQYFPCQRFPFWLSRRMMEKAAASLPCEWPHLYLGGDKLDEAGR